MLQTRILIPVLVFLFLIPFALFSGSANQSASMLRRITHTSSEVNNLNPSLSGDGRQIVFESSTDLARSGNSAGFHALSAILETESSTFTELARTRVVAPGVSQDGTAIVFSSLEDLTGQNNDRNSEIFLKTTEGLKQITNTSPGGMSSRMTDGNFQPSITDDSRLIGFSSNRNLTGRNSDLNFEIFLLDTETRALVQVTDAVGTIGSTDPKISGDGSALTFIRNNSLAADTNRDLCLYSLGASTTRVIAGNMSGIALAYGRAISDDGSRVVYSSTTSEHQSQVFLFDVTDNASRQITALGTRISDVPLNATISGDGKRIAFATRRRVTAVSDGGVELYIFDVPSQQFVQVTDAPANATAEVVSSLNDDGGLIVFNFPRIISETPSSSDEANNSEIYVAVLPARPAFGSLTVLNAASLGSDPGPTSALPRGGIVNGKGTALASETRYALRLVDDSFPVSLAGTKITVNGVESQVLYVSPTEVSFVIPDETPVGSAEIIVTNREGFQSRSTELISSAAPGIFSSIGQGKGSGVVLDAETLLPGPFDPTNDNLRLILFLTGVRHANEVSLTIGGRRATIEAVLSSPDLPGLDEIHALVPGYLRGAGVVDLLVEADEQKSNIVTTVLSGSSLRDIVVNELLADPPNGIAGDANRDGTRNSSDDEFIELVNSTTRDLDLSGYQLQTRTLSGTTDVVRHRFSNRMILSAKTALVVFGGGNLNASDPAFGGAGVIKASSGSLSLANSGSVITLRDASGSIVSFISYGGTTGLHGDENESLTRFPDVSGEFVLHRIASGNANLAFSPGLQVGGARFIAHPSVLAILLAPQLANLLPGQQQQFTARAIGDSGEELRDVIFRWSSTDQAVATVDQNGMANALSRGTTMITASARSVQSGPASLLVSDPSPSPTPISSPTPVPTPSPTPLPSVTPVPSPSPNVSPSPTPAPSPLPALSISELRTRGPNGASDEFIEIYNYSDASIAIGGLKIKGSSSSGNVTTRLTVANGTSIPSHGHFLVTNSSGYSGTVSADQTYSSGIADDGGIAITTGANQIIDQVGMSAGSAFKEGAFLNPQSGTANQSYERKPGGQLGSSQDTNDNQADFQLVVSDPQNLTSSPVPAPSPSPTPTLTPLPSPSATPSPMPSPSPSPSPTPSAQISLVISQVFGGGGNSEAPFRNDFVEVFNKGTLTVDLTEWSVQYASASSGSWSVTNLSGSLAPGQYYLIQEASGGSAGQNLPAADAVGTINLASGSGKVALVNTTTPLSGMCPSSNNTLVGYGATASCFEGSGPSAAPGNGTSIQRSSDGCFDTQNNSSDFVTSQPNPRNRLSEFHSCPIADRDKTTADYLAEWFFAEGLHLILRMVFG